MNIILFQPQIPQNTGNIVRTCAVTGASLFLVKPLGFQISNKKLKRAGLDYWDDVNIQVIEDFPSFLQSLSGRLFFFSSRATSFYTEVAYTKEDYLVFGSETEGLPSHLWERFPQSFYTIPQREETRCLNLSNAVSIVLYEAWRQQGFLGI